MNKPLSLYQKILAVQQAAKAIKKNGENKFHSYKYATEQDVLAIKNLMNEQSLIAFPSLVDYETLQYVDDKSCMRIQVLQKIKYTVVDAETGDQVETIVLGQGEDKQGDKAAYKAATGASKYFYLKFFGVATGDDPEMDIQVSNPQKQKNVASEASQQPRVQNQNQPNDLERQRAQKAASKLVDLQKQYGYSNEQVKAICGIKSIDGLVKGGYAGSLERAVQRLESNIKQAAY